ncbi:MAG: MBL fold metallo-hydrolase [Opitutales bacterium]|nr:MBL fold metallo-hydrolase [Opitutales bacterium]
MIACDCPVCQSSDPRNWRDRTSLYVCLGGLSIQVDAAPEFRRQCLRSNIRKVDLFILTHGHADHVQGMDDLRRFCDQREGEALPVYSTPEGLERIRDIFPYAVVDRALTKGYPAFDLHEMPSRLELPTGTIQSVLLPHGSLEVLGLVFTERATGQKLVYYTDCKKVGASAAGLAKGADVVILDALRYQPHPSHMSIDEAVSTALHLAAPQTYFTHLTHTADHSRLEAELPATISPAYDGLWVDLDKRDSGGCSGDTLSVSKSS